MASAVATVEFRSPWPPHRVLATALPANLTWGFGPIDQPSKASFSLPSNDPVFSIKEIGDGFAPMVTIRRTDGWFPWAGWVTDDADDIESPEAQFTLQDHAGALYASSRVAKDWPVQERSSAQIIKDIYAECDGRAEPPLLTKLDAVVAGPTVAYTPQAESFLQFLQTIANATGWEWALSYVIGGKSVDASLLWQSKLGRDHSKEITFEQGVHFKNVSRARSADGYLTAAVGVGGTGTFATRPAAQYNATGRADGSISGSVRALSAAAAASPLYSGTRVIIEPQITNLDALRAAALRSFSPPDRVAERLTFHLVESTIDLSKIELGSIYHVKYTMRGVAQERDVRAFALNIDLSGVLQLVGEVQRAA